MATLCQPAPPPCIPTQLLAADKFPWSLFAADSKGIATKYHWAPTTPQSGGPVEASIQGVNSPLTEITHGFCMNLVFAEVANYVPPTDCNLPDRFSTIVRSSYSNLKENRAKGLTCRTWLLVALRILKEAGCISHDKSQIAQIERTIIATAIGVENELADFGQNFCTVGLAV